MMRKISNRFPVEFVNGMTIALQNIDKQGNISAQFAMFVLTNIKWGGGKYQRKYRICGNRILLRKRYF